jgi:3-oxoadipate enol-lactonase
VSDRVRLDHRVIGPDGAPTLLLLNALGTDMSMWDEQIPAFARDHRVITYDARGQGASDVPPAPYSVEDFARDALGLLDDLEIERASLCGISLGGQPALWIAAHHPERVERAIFANTAARIGTAELWAERAGLVRDGGMEAVRVNVLARFFREEFIAARPDVVARYSEMLASAPPEGYIGACLALKDSDLRDLVTSISMPALVVGATGDVSTPVADAQWLHDHIPGSEFHVLEDTGHLSPVERPDRFNATVGAFLARA